MPNIPFIHFDSSVATPAESFLQWRSANPAFEISTVGPSEAFRARTRAWVLGDIVVSTTSTTPVRFVRTAQRIAADGIDRYILLLTLGTWRGNIGGREITVGPGQVIVLDLTRPMDARGDSDTLSLSIARPLLDCASFRDADVHGLIFDEAAGRLIADHLMLLIRCLPAMKIEEAPQAVKSAAGLLAACIAETVSARTGGDARRHARIRHRVSRYIDDHLRSPGLSPETICKRLGLSRSVLYRAFQPLSGIAEYIRTRRLEAVHVLIEASARGRGSIMELARSFGFASEAHFSRTFRDRFGYSPRRARNGGGHDIDALAALADSRNAADLFRAWLRHLK
jgi:AraC-like DNA-binding protein